MTDLPPPAPASGSLVKVLLAFGLLALGVCVLLPSVQSESNGARRLRSTNNVKQILLAMHNYESALDSFPSAYVADANGKPLYSWRVHILPFLEEQPLYDQFNKDEVWDGPTNRRPSQAVLRCYLDPFDPLDQPNTSYVAVTGPGTCFEGANGITFDRIKDGTSNTLMLAQIANSTIRWAEPKDLDASRMSLEVNAPGASISGKHRGGAFVGLADGSVRFLSDKTSPEIVRGLLTVHGGEVPVDF